MTLIAFGFELSARDSKHKISIDEKFIERFLQETSVDEFCCFHSPDWLLAFAVCQEEEQLLTAFMDSFSRASGATTESLKKCTFKKTGSEAVREFLKQAIAWRDVKEPRLSIQEFRELFMQARDKERTGPLLNRLYQRSVWLTEKIRIEIVLQENAVTPESVVAELAEKIFGELQDHSALITASSPQVENCLDRLSSKKIGQLIFLEADQGKMNGLAEKYKGETVSARELSKAMERVDVLLTSDGELTIASGEKDIPRMMSRRNNAPLLWVDFGDDEGKRSSIQNTSGHYNIYYYNVADLESIVASNLQEHQKTARLIAKLIEKEAADFILWVNSKDRYRFGDIVGKSKSMQKILEMVAQIAQTDISVLIDGESGTGKELVARAIHEHSSRARNAFIVVNCGAIPDNLLESELFGHVRGAFTGATANKKGLFETANHGTILLDEIGETSLSMQVKLLRFLQEGEIKPVGSNVTLKLDVRLITATNRDLGKMVEDGHFRQDLYYRLNVIQLTVPPLRDRKDDIPPLIDFFMKKYGKKIHKSIDGVQAGVLQSLLDYPWPGNIRELENAVERAVALCSGGLLDLNDFPSHITSARVRTDGKAIDGDMSLRELEKNHIAETLARNNWDYELVTRILGIGRTTLWRKMKAYNISNLPESSKNLN